LPNFRSFYADLPVFLTLTLCCMAQQAVSAQETASQSAKPWTVRAIYDGSIHASTAEPPAETGWSPDGSMLSYATPEHALGAIDVQTGARSILVPAATLAPVVAHAQAHPVGEQDRDHRARYSQKGYFWSPDGSQILFDVDGSLWLDSLKTKQMRQIGDTEQGSGDDAQFSPDGKTIAYVHDHNLYALQPGSQPVALTMTGSANLRNGEVDWVYLEELKVRTNYSWSPDSAHIAYVQMDETKVPSYPITDWIPTHATVEEQKYPQAGDPNPAVRVGVVAALGGPTQWIDLPMTGAYGVRANEDYIPRSGWLDAKTVWIEALNRDHKHFGIWFADVATGTAKLALSLTDPKFFDENYDLDWSAPGNLLLRSWRTGHMHIDRYTYAVEKPTGLHLEGQLEKGDYEVSDILSVDHGTVYYLSSEGDEPGEQVWAVGLDGTGKHRITTADGTHKVEFADGRTTFTDKHSSLTTKPVLDLCTVAGAAAPHCLNLWKETGPVGHTMRPPELLTLKAADGKTTIYATLLLPPGATAAASVPLINNPYGGPGSATVTDSWSVNYFDQLLAEHGYAVLHVDNRGMAGQGRAFEQACYHDFGKVQLADQMAAIDQVLAKYPQLDSKRLGWWGWSWGGTFTLNALTHSDRFRAGVSVAPVTDFRNYDSIYTERYLGLPEAQAGMPAETAVYDAASVQRTAGQLHGHLLIAHGTGDDNVHMENTIQFVQKLIDAHKPYALQLFPRKTHSIAGADARIELYDRILAQFETYLMPKVDASGR
jgi:dipeptidyl-peptidase-4